MVDGVASLRTNDPCTRGLDDVAGRQSYCLPPFESSPNQTFTLTVEPFESLNHQPFEQWFESRTQVDVVRRGTITGTQQARSPQAGYFLKTQFVKDSAGKPWLILYAGSSAADGTTQFAAMVTDLNEQSANNR